MTCTSGDYPQILFVESIAQLGGIAAAQEKGGGGILAAIDRAEFHGAVRDGDTLTVAVWIAKSFGPLHLVEGVVSMDGKVLAAATVTLKVGTLL